MWNASRNSRAVTTAIGQAADGATDSRHRQGMNEAYSRTTPISAQKPVPPAPQPPLNSGPRSDIRALDSGRGKSGSPEPCARLLQAVPDLSPIYQRLNDVFHIRSDRQHYRRDL